MKFLRAAIRMYSLRFARTIVVAYRNQGSSLIGYLHWFWNSKTYYVKGRLWPYDRPAVLLLIAAMLSQIGVAVYYIADWVRLATPGGLPFAIAILVSYPLIVAHLFVGAVLLKRFLYYLVHPKKLGKAIVSGILEAQVRRLRRKHRFTVIAVAGSIGKTSTKLAIAELLGQNLRVCYQAGNYNDRLTVPLVFFEQDPPALWNVFGWMRLFGENIALLAQTYPYDVVVVELGTDGPGQMRKFAYLKPDVTILTAITPEHMAYFKTLDAVAEEETAIFTYSKQVLVNSDNVPAKYLIGQKFNEYSITTNTGHNYYAKTSHASLKGQKLEFAFPGGGFDAEVAFVGEQGSLVSLAAAATADVLGQARPIIKQALAAIEPFAGRMRVLSGIEGSTIIDDTYNASPEPVIKGLDVLYAAPASQRIAILGSMNELGDYAMAAHRQVGLYCDAKKLDMVITIGADAKRWLAPAARESGCQVHSFTSPYDAGQFVRKHMAKKTVVLGEGSQNGVFAEEALKPLLAHPSDASKLVRQSKSWLKRKQKQFKV